MLPGLRSLTIDHRGCVFDPLVTVAPLPSLKDVPTPSHLAIHQTHLEEDTILDFVARYGQNLEVLSLEAVEGDTCKTILAILRHRNLKKLVIKYADSTYWESQEYDLARGRYTGYLEVLLGSLQEDCINDLAEEVVLLPAGLDEVVKRFRSKSIGVGSDSDEELEEGNDEASYSGFDFSHLEPCA